MVAKKNHKKIIKNDVSVEFFLDLFFIGAVYSY
jgi:hypothetical protein